MIKNFQDKLPKIHESVFIAENAIVIGDVEIGTDSSVWYGCILRGDVNYIRIGERTNIQDASVIHVSAKTHPTVLEDEITVGHRVTLHGCYVESNCLIGINSVILDGARYREKFARRRRFARYAEYENSCKFSGDGKSGESEKRINGG